MEDKLIKVINVKNEIEAQMIMDILADEAIHSEKQHVGSGQYLTLYMGVSPGGIDIFVWEHDLEMAIELVEAFFEGESVEDK